MGFFPFLHDLALQEQLLGFGVEPFERRGIDGVGFFARIAVELSEGR